MRARRASRDVWSDRLRRVCAGLLCVVATASVASAAHAHAHGGAALALVAAPVGPPCAGELAHAGGATPAGAHCRSCQELSQARAALPRSASALPSLAPRSAAHTAARLALCAQRAAAAHPSRAPPRV